jgi:hypothetical protein
MRDQVGTQRQIVEVAFQKSAHAVVGGADYRLLVHIEAGVDDPR